MNLVNLFHLNKSLYIVIQKMKASNVSKLISASLWICPCRVLFLAKIPKQFVCFCSTIVVSAPEQDQVGGSTLLALGELKKTQQVWTGDHWKIPES